MRAIGVEIDQRDELREIRAEREVILSAGAYASPQILLLTGIGPAADLELARRPVRLHELPVGQGLQDHLVDVDHVHDRRAVAADGGDRGEPRASSRPRVAVR